MLIKEMGLGLAVLFLVSASISMAQSQTNKAVKFDEFGDIYSSDLKARLDNFAIQLQSQPASKGFIMVYRSRRDTPGLNITLAMRMQDYLINTRGLNKDQIVTVDGGVAGCIVQELWIVPPSTAPVPRQDAQIGYFYHPDTAWKFLDYGYLTPEEITRYNLSSGLAIDDQYLEAFATEVKKIRNSTACVIVYAQYNKKRELVDYTGEYEPVPTTRLDRQGTAQKRMAREAEVLIKRMGIPANRVKTIDGGYRKNRSIELWVVPFGEPLPVATPNSYPTGWKGSAR